MCSSLLLGAVYLIDRPSQGIRAGRRTVRWWRVPVTESTDSFTRNTPRFRSDVKVIALAGVYIDPPTSLGSPMGKSASSSRGAASGVSRTQRWPGQSPRHHHVDMHPSMRLRTTGAACWAAGFLIVLRIVPAVEFTIAACEPFGDDHGTYRSSPHRGHWPSWPACRRWPRCSHLISASVRMRPLRIPTQAR